MTFPKLAALAVPLVLSASMAWGATYNFNVKVVESIDTVPSPTFDLPDLGSMGTVSILLDGATLDADGDPLTGVNIDPFPLSTSLAGASATIGGLSASLDAPNVFGFSGGARFSNGSFSNIVISLVGANCPALGCTLAGSFSILKAGAPAPTTFTGVEALLMDPAATAVFSFNGTVQGESVSFRAESVAAVPLPASGLLLLGGVIALGRLRKPG